MKNSLIKGALCAVLCVGTAAALTEHEFEALLSATRQHSAQQARLKKVYGSVYNKVTQALKDEEVVEARKKIYVAIKHLDVLLRTKIQLDEQEKAAFDQLAVVIKNSKGKNVGLQDRQLLEDSSEAIKALFLEMASTQADFEKILENTLKAELEMFKNC